MRNDGKKERKRKELERRGTLNPRAERVKDPAFLESDFLDSEDLVQVKYEMLRRVSTEGCTVTEAVGRFGVSRPTFYRAQSDFEQGGLVGLVPERRRRKGTGSGSAPVGARAPASLALWSARRNPHYSGRSCFSRPLSQQERPIQAARFLPLSHSPSPNSVPVPELRPQPLSR